ncbi:MULTISPECIES: SDR family oxidoreductase [unclassified Butyricimonas]|uniref:SDR family oxidoreductase n=1 Tax=unclassified Butyricimonas TaxID=2637652 RepID=UPI00159BC3EF|nr:MULTISPECIES: SDR family oxidoreductase [unclassified Butyricimonas]
MDLTGKQILVIGGVSDIDKAIIRQISNLGANVICYDEHDTSKIETDIKEIVKNNRIFDGMVFCFVHSDFRPLLFVKPNYVNEILNDNFNVFIEVMRSINKAKGLKEGASVVAMSSISSIRAMKAKMVFCAAKAALDAAIRCLAVELADKRVRVNSVQKGGVDVDFEKEHIQNINILNEEFTSQKQVLGISKAEEIANVVTFLLSDATRTITGTSIVIDGGYTL